MYVTSIVSLRALGGGAHPENINFVKDIKIQIHSLIGPVCTPT